MLLRSFKLHFTERRIRVLPLHDLVGGPFQQVGVDVLGAEAEPLFASAAALRAWFTAREPEAEVRSLSFDLPRGRALATLHAAGGAVHALRVDEASGADLFDHARALEPELARAARQVLERRTA